MTTQRNMIPEEEINEINEAQIKQFRVETRIREQISSLRMQAIMNIQDGMFHIAIDNLQEIIRLAKTIRNQDT